MFYSFDVFDTLITRKTATPEGVFVIMKQILLTNERYARIPMSIKENFIAFRKGAQKMAWRLFCDKECQETTLYEIYSVLSDMKKLDKELTGLLHLLEREVEMDFITGVKKNIDYLFSLVDQGNRIVLITDMYLHENDIRKMLVKTNERFSNIPIYVSSSYRKRKDKGTLFEIVKERENVNYEDWCHIGDNPISDGEVPVSLGIKTMLEPQKKLLTYEEYLLNRNHDNSYLELLLGAGLNARTWVMDNEMSNKQAFSYGSTLLPLVVDGYIQWVLESAIKANIKTLYFIARDGYLLKKMADWIIAKSGYSIKTAYLHGSRFCWRAPLLNDKDWDITRLCKLSDSKKYLYPLDMADIFGFSKEELRPFIPESIDINKLIGPNGKRWLSEHLEKDKSFKEYYTRKHNENRSLAKKYLYEQIDFDEKYAFVEFTGSGYTQLKVANLIEEMGHKPTINFYCHLTRQFKQENCKFFSYYPNENVGSRFLELFLSAPHGRTVGYVEDGNGVVNPVLDGESDYLKSYGYEDIRKGFDCFLLHHSLNKPQKSIELLYQLEQYMSVSPDSELLDFIGDMPFGATGKTMDLDCFAPRLTRREIMEIFLFRRFEPISLFYSGVSFNSSLLRCTNDEVRLIASYKEKRLTRESVCKRDKLMDLKVRDFDVISWCGLLPEVWGKKILIYGAGELGKMIYKEIGAYNRIDVAGWTDKNYVELVKDNTLLIDPNEAFSMNIDKVVIAIRNNRIASKVRTQLLARGFKADNILIPNL